MIVQNGKWFDPKPGHEFQYWLAWKHREIAGGLMLKATKRLIHIWRPHHYRRIFDLWANAVDRIKTHGQDRILN